MRGFAFITPLVGALALAAAASAQTPDVIVTVGPEVDVEELGVSEVNEQADELAQTVREALARSGALDGARVHLVITDIKPNRPTWQQGIDTPGLDMFRSISLGGATIEGEIVSSDGARRTVSYDRYSNNLRDVFGSSTWRDAGLAFNTFARRLAEGRL